MLWLAPGDPPALLLSLALVLLRPRTHRRHTDSSPLHAARAPQTARRGSSTAAPFLGFCTIVMPPIDAYAAATRWALPGRIRRPT